jgi:acetyl-CoA acetyltransferase
MEFNKAIAAQAIAVNREMAWDTAKVDVNGGTKQCAKSSSDF